MAKKEVALGPVSVDDNFVRVGSKSYAINKITSIDVRVDPPKPNKSVALLVLAFAAFIIGLGFHPLLLLALVLGYFGWKESRRPPLRMHHLILMMASTEAAALHTTDEGQAEQLRSDIENAMVRAR